MGNGHPQGNAKIYSQKPKRTSSIYNLIKTEIRRDSRFQLKKTGDSYAGGKGLFR